MIVLLVAISAAPAFGREYQCVVGEGRLIWQDIPCKGDLHGGMNTVGEEMERRKREKARVTEQELTCQDRFKGKLEVTNSSWDGSVYQVESYLKRSYLKDPDSFQAIEWGKVKKNCGTYVVTVKYRARNSLGGYVVETMIVTLNADGNVTGVVPYR
jgi:hypothetical protein